MKNVKSNGIFLIIVMSFFLFPLTSKALAEGCVKAGSCIKMCEWKNKDATISTYYVLEDKSIQYGWKFENDSQTNAFHKADSKYVEFQDDGIKESLASGNCSVGAYASTDNFWNRYVCFDSGNGECSSKNGVIWKKYGGETTLIFNLDDTIKNTFKNVLDPNFDCSSVVDSTGYKVDEIKLKQVTDGYYSTLSDRLLKGGDLNILKNNSTYISEKEKFNSNVKLRANQCQTQFNLNRSEAVANGTLSEEESNQIVNSISGLESNVENVLNSSEASAGNSLEPGISDPGLSSPSTGGEASCTGILGNGDTLKYTKMALTIIQIGGGVLAIILSMIDFMGAIMSGDADINKKFSKKLMIRVTMAAILLLVPALLKFILNTFGLSEYGNSFCIL